MNLPNYPEYKSTNFNGCFDEAIFINREITSEEMWSNYPLDKFIKIYIMLRAAAVRVNLTDQQLNPYLIINIWLK